MSFKKNPHLKMIPVVANNKNHGIHLCEICVHHRVVLIDDPLPSTVSRLTDGVRVAAPQRTLATRFLGQILSSKRSLNNDDVWLYRMW